MPVSSRPALPSRAVHVAAPAKVNLSLHITGQRSDGYHLLESLVAFAGTGDLLTLEPAATLSLDITGPRAASLGDLPAEDNIILKAARALATATGCTDGAAITLHKVLPVAAGIGGGSADAAAALQGLMRLWGVSLPRAQMLSLATSLGADVPVCLRGCPTLMTGIGEQLHEAPPLPASWLVLCNPGIPLSTPAVFRARAGAFSEPSPLEDAPASADALALMLSRRRNDLTSAAISLAPEIGVALAALASLPGCLLSRMSGSGATCWGLFATEYDANTAARQLQHQYPCWWVEAAPLLGDVDPFALADRLAVPR